MARVKDALCLVPSGAAGCRGLDAAIITGNRPLALAYYHVLFRFIPEIDTQPAGKRPICLFCDHEFSPGARSMPNCVVVLRHTVGWKPRQIIMTGICHTCMIKHEAEDSFSPKLLDAVTRKYNAMFPGLDLEV